jgi:hypothetical protein
MREKCTKRGIALVWRFIDTEVPSEITIYHFNYSNADEILTMEFNIAKKIFSDSPSV